MPKTITLGGKSYSIGTKSEFTKLLISHGVVGADTKALSDAVQAIEVLPGSLRSIGLYVKPIHALSTASKAFKQKYSSKHPKFIQSFTTKFLVPADKVLDVMTELSKEFPVIEERFIQAGKFFNNAATKLSKVPLDAQVIDETTSEMASGGSLLTNAQNATNQLFRETGVPALEKIFNAALAIRPLFEDIDKTVHIIKKNNDYTADVKSTIAKILKLRDGCNLFVKILKESS